MRPPVEVSVLILSLSAPGVFITMNNIPALQEPLPILGMGMVVLGLVLLLLLLTVRNLKKVDPLFYVFAGFSFTCMVFLTNALEQDGFISGFMAFYLKMGEPHLRTAYAVMTSYWEGVVHLLLFLTIIHRMFRGKSYRSLGLLWAGSSSAIIVHIPGVVIGKYGSNIQPAFWRNVPFFLVPFWAASLLFSRPREMPVVTADKIIAEQKKGLLSRPVDLLLSLLLLGAMAFSVFRGFVVLDCPLDACFTYVYQYEPYLKDPVGFPRVMVNAGVSFLCSSPADCLHLWSENTWMQLDVGLDHLLSRGHGSDPVVPYRSISALPHSLHVPGPSRQMVACYHPQCAAGCCAGSAGPALPQQPHLFPETCSRGTDHQRKEEKLD
ncbi:transmembrane 6 superfamily member 2 isoform X1 [Etheostoma spectabile]|uniref:transmembrane 6 superfamily member 2 isoform X1 n=1 Tax=Etheostoma spectabile TaxID=54343 RepID=UPI0013AEACB2|nr:transmembrane 6 superfamily member 2-like isoform X1 [Etheostoma spectabile]